MDKVYTCWIHIFHNVNIICLLMILLASMVCIHSLPVTVGDPCPCVLLSGANPKTKSGPPKVAVPVEKSDEAIVVENKASEEAREQALFSSIAAVVTSVFTTVSCLLIVAFDHVLRTFAEHALMHRISAGNEREEA